MEYVWQDTRAPRRQAHTCVDKRAHSEKHAHADTHVETQMRKDTYIQAHIHVIMCKFQYNCTHTDRNMYFCVCMLWKV